MKIPTLLKRIIKRIFPKSRYGYNILRFSINVDVFGYITNKTGDREKDKYLYFDYINSLIQAKKDGYDRVEILDNRYKEMLVFVLKDNWCWQGLE